MQLNHSNVNFVPEQVILQQKTKAQALSGLKIAIMISILCCSAYGGLWFYNRLKQREIDNILRSIEEQKAVITRLAEFGQKGYKLGVRLEAARDVIQGRNIYSRLFNELNGKVIDTIALTDITFTSPTTVTVMGKAQGNYAPVGEYTQRLLENVSMFEDIKITQASGSGEKDAVEFTLNIKLKEGGLHESVK